MEKSKRVMKREFYTQEESKGNITNTLNLDNVKGVSVTTYSDKQIREMLSNEDLQEFLELIGYENS